MRKIYFFSLFALSLWESGCMQKGHQTPVSQVSKSSPQKSESIGCGLLLGAGDLAAQMNQLKAHMNTFDYKIVGAYWDENPRVTGLFRFQSKIRGPLMGKVDPKSAIAQFNTYFEIVAKDVMALAKKENFIIKTFLKTIKDKRTMTNKELLEFILSRPGRDALPKELVKGMEDYTRSREIVVGKVRDLTELQEVVRVNYSRKTELKADLVARFKASALIDGVGDLPDDSGASFKNLFDETPYIIDSRGGVGDLPDEDGAALDRLFTLDETAGTPDANPTPDANQTPNPGNTDNSAIREPEVPPNPAPTEIPNEQDSTVKNLFDDKDTKVLTPDEVASGKVAKGKGKYIVGAVAGGLVLTAAVITTILLANKYEEKNKTTTFSEGSLQLAGCN